MDHGVRKLAVAVVISVALCGCSENRGDPIAANVNEVSFGGSLVSGGNLANAAVTDQNKFTLSQDVFWQLYLSYVAALKQAGQAPETGTVRILGNFNGNAVVESQPIAIQPGNQTVIYDATITYNDYSQDGKLYLGGQVSFHGTWAEVANATLPVELRLDGGVAYAGGFEGTIEFIDFKLGIDSVGNLIPPGTAGSGFAAEGRVLIVSSDQQLIVIPYPVRL